MSSQPGVGPCLFKADAELPQRRGINLPDW